MASLTEVAKAVLKGQNQLTEGAIPSISKDGDAADRDATKKTSNHNTLHAGSKYKEGPKKLAGEVQDLGPAVTKPTDSTSGPSKAAQGVSKDGSKSSKSKVPGQKAQSLGEEPEVEETAEVVAEEPVVKTSTADRIKALAEQIRKAKEEQALAEQEDAAKEEEIEISEEALEFIQAKIEEGLSEEEIFAALDEEFEIAEETDELPQEMKDFIDKKIEEGLSQDEVMAAVNEEFGGDDHAETEDQPAEVVAEAEELVVDMTEHVDALFSGETLSEDFKNKAKTILETAVKQKVEEERKKIEEAAAAHLAEEIERVSDELTENVDDYLNYVVEDWADSNAIAIESSLRTELTEEFIAGLRQLFAENYIDIPADKVPVVEELTAKIAEVESKLNEEIAKNVELSKAVNEGKKDDIVAEAATSLTQTQKEKFKTLVEGVEYSNIDEFKAKVKTIKESYFPSTVKNDGATPEEKGHGLMTEDTSPRMEKYLRTLGAKLPN